MIIVSFVPVLFIAVAYFLLNRRDPNCGACYAWLSMLVSPMVGWFSGWVQVVVERLWGSPPCCSRCVGVVTTAVFWRTRSSRIAS